MQIRRNNSIITAFSDFYVYLFKQQICLNQRKGVVKTINFHRTFIQHLADVEFMSCVACCMNVCRIFRWSLLLLFLPSFSFWVKPDVSEGVTQR